MIHHTFIITASYFFVLSNQFFGPEGTAHRYYAPFLSSMVLSSLLGKYTSPSTCMKGSFWSE